MGDCDTGLAAMSRLLTTAFAAIIMLASPAVVLSAPSAAPALSGAEVLAQSRAIYAAMKSYADNGVVRTEFTVSPTIPLTIERHSFHTVYSAPRKFLLDFKKSESGERLVIWGDGENFHTWWSETGVHEVYPRGQGASAFAVSSLPTLGAALAVPPLLFSQAGLHGALSDFGLLRGEGVESFDGRSFYKLVGTVSLAYGTGAVRAMCRKTPNRRGLPHRLPFRRRIPRGPVRNSPRRRPGRQRRSSTAAIRT